ncbi:MAG: hypothetical protein IJV03_03030, partial [Alphaproteobacteria bacterium]|nr:hypothetical protein [Alphaproteobacteria bacterium]
MNKIFKLISILPALLVLPAMAVNVSNWSDFVTSIKTAGETTSLDNDLIMYEMMGPKNGVINGNGNTLKALSISGTPELVNTQPSYEWQYTNVNGDVVKFYSEKSSLSAINATEVFSDPEMQNSLGYIDYKSGDKFDISGRGTTKNYTVVMDEEGFVNGVYKAEPTSATAKNTYYTVCLQDVDSGEKLYVAKSMKITEDGYTVDQILSQNSLTYTTDLERQNTIAGKGVSAGQDGEYTVAFPDILVLDNNGSFIAKPHKEYVVDGESIYISATANIDTTKTVYVNPDLSGSVVVDRTFLIPSFHGVNNTIYLGSNGTDLTINDLTMSDFVYNSSSNYGAVLTSKNANLTVNNSTFKNNTNNDTLLGGAVSILGDKATFTNTTFDNNTAKGAGAGLMIGNNVLAKGSILDRTYEYHNSVVSIKDSVFKNNSTIDVGGAVYSTVVNHSEANKRGLETVDNEVIINGTSFVSNHADKAAGAIGNFSKMTIQTSGFSHNTTDGQGGVMFLGAESKTLISRSMFENNSAGTLGGVIRTRDASEANNQAAKLDILSGTQFLRNSAENGGVLYNNFYDSKTNAGSVTVLGATFLDNTANENGGAIFNSGDKDANNAIGNINITDTTFAKNSAKNGGAVYNAGDMKITDTRNYRNSGYMFKENSVSANGGAIYNTGNLELNKVSFLDNSASANGGAIYNAGTLVLSGTNEFSGNKAQNSANDIYNVGDLTIANGTTTIDGGIAGTGDLIIANGSTLNIGSAKINQNNITLNGTLIADLFADGDAFLTATQSFEGNGNLSVAVEKVGTYNIFGDKVFANAKNQIISSVFDLTWSQDGKSFDASLKSADKIVEDTGA